MAVNSVLEWGLAVFVLLVLQLCQPSVASSVFFSSSVEGVAEWVPPEYSTISMEDHVAAIIGSAGVSDTNGADKPGVLERVKSFFKVCNRHRPTGTPTDALFFLLGVPNIEWCAST